VRWALLLSFMLGAGCASTSPGESFRDVSAEVEQRSGHALHWNRSTPEDAQAEAATDRLLGGPLGVAQAIEVALLNNRTLTATYEELSIAQADVVQAGLLRNPIFGAGRTVAEGDRLDPNLELSLAWDFLDLLMVPAKTKIAATERDATKARVADVVLDVVADVQRAYFALVAAQQVAAMRKIVADAAQASSDVAAEQSNAGNINDLTLTNEQSNYEQFALDLAQAQAEVAEARERLARLLGVWGKRALFRVADRLPQVPAEDPPIDRLESLAIAQRLDLEATRKEREAIGRALSLVESTRFTPGIGVGVSAGRLNDGNISVAPSGSLELPIFDQKQAQIARLEAMLRASDDRLRAHAVDIRAEVRAARQRMDYARATVARYRGRVIPLRERLVALSQQQYDAMLLGVYQLLGAKQSEVSAYREAIEAARNYWLARVDLERAVAVRLPSAPPAAAPPQALPAAEPTASPPTREHHHPSPGDP
jgi:outer membrane protein, heavy metal efflux system